VIDEPILPFPASWMECLPQATRGKSMTGECTHTIVRDVFVAVGVEDAKKIVDKKLETT
jgi:hypothetical protein